MRTIWNRITLECYRQPGDEERAPWYAYPLALAFIVGAYALVQTLDAVGY